MLLKPWLWSTHFSSANTTACMLHLLSAPLITRSLYIFHSAYFSLAVFFWLVLVHKSCMSLLLFPTSVQCCAFPFLYVRIFHLLLMDWPALCRSSSVSLKDSERNSFYNWWLMALVSAVWLYFCQFFCCFALLCFVNGVFLLPGPIIIIIIVLRARHFFEKW